MRSRDPDLGSSQRVMYQTGKLHRMASIPMQTDRFRNDVDRTSPSNHIAFRHHPYHLFYRLSGINDQAQSWLCVSAA